MSKRKSNNSCYSATEIVLFGLTGVLFVLELTGIISIGWEWVFSPIWLFILGYVMFIVAIIIRYTERNIK